MDWSSVLRIAGVVLLDIVLLAGLLAIPLGLSGNWIVLAAALVVAIVTKFQAIGWAALIIMALLTIILEILETVFASIMARKYGATKWGMSGALVGGWGGALLGGIVGATLGTFVLPIVGTLIGSFLGTAVGAILFEVFRGSDRRTGARAGWGAFLGKIYISVIKLAVGIGIVAYIVVRVH